MATYNSPGVYIQDIKSGSQSITQASSSIGVLLTFMLTDLTHLS